ncbi:MAG: ABC transporter substrate-binding protein [Egibacteraceae bacterium]
MAAGVQLGDRRRPGPLRRYWGEQSSIDRVELKVIPDSQTRVSALRAGEVDLLGGTYLAPITPVEAKELQSADGIQLLVGEPDTTVVLSFNPDGPLADRAVRVAVARAIDREALTPALYGDLGQPADTLFPPSIPDSPASRSTPGSTPTRPQRRGPPPQLLLGAPTPAPRSSRPAGSSRATGGPQAASRSSWNCSLRRLRSMAGRTHASPLRRSRSRSRRWASALITPGGRSRSRSCHAKQPAGVGQARNRTPRAVERTVPFGLLCLSLAIVWYAQAGHSPEVVAERRRRAPWHACKANPSVADMFAVLRRGADRRRISPTTP